ALMKTVMAMHQSNFEWKKPPYEYEYKKKPIDLIMGDSSLRRDLESGASLTLIMDKWRADLESFIRWRRPYLLYS
ncbi:MAG: DUF1343 domain-containing protein, partial [Deltaproteobacteria bacterium]|nr:DUF1343 domain-containing protein [Deltaproteobacteria bacterium]